MRRMHVEMVVVERVEKADTEVIEVKDGLCRYFNKDIKLEAYRFTFIAERITDIKEAKNVDSSKYLASTVLVNYESPIDSKWYSFINKAIVVIPHMESQPLLNNYIHVFRDFNCSVGIGDGRTHDYILTGTFFCQQNGLTSVCAHASLCMIINNIEKRELISTEWINKKLGIDHVSEKIGDGLNSDQVLKVLSEIGLTINFIDFTANPDLDYAENIYRYLEGNCPILLVFSTNSTTLHVVPVIGHTLNSDNWLAEAELAYKKPKYPNYQPTSKWVDHFIIHDDNFGTYLCLPVDTLKKDTPVKDDPTLRAFYAIAVVPIEVSVPAPVADRASVLITKWLLSNISKIPSINKWLKYLNELTSPWAVRTLLMKKEAYIKHLTGEADFEGNRYQEDEIIEMTTHLPNIFWLSEITLPDLYHTNKTKIIDVLFKSESNDFKDVITDDILYRNCIQIRMPEACLIIESKNSIKLSVSSHFPLYRHEKSINPPQW